LSRLDAHWRLLQHVGRFAAFAEEQQLHVERFAKEFAGHLAGVADDEKVVVDVVEQFLAEVGDALFHFKYFFCLQSYAFFPDSVF